MMEDWENKTLYNHVNLPNPPKVYLPMEGLPASGGRTPAFAQRAMARQESADSVLSFFAQNSLCSLLFPHEGDALRSKAEMRE